MTEKTYKFPAHFKRFCDARDCDRGRCPFTFHNVCALDDPDKAEAIIMSWVLENPEPKSVTWEEWWLGMFPGMKKAPCPESFGIYPPCIGVMCSDCWKTTIVPDDMVKAFESVPRPVRANESED